MLVPDNNAVRRCCGKIRGQTVMGGESFFYLFVYSLQNKAGSVWSLSLVLHTVPMHHPSPFIMLHMGDIGLNWCGLLQLHLLVSPQGMHCVCMCGLCLRIEAAGKYGESA